MERGMGMHVWWVDAGLRIISMVDALKDHLSLPLLCHASINIDFEVSEAGCPESLGYLGGRTMRGRDKLLRVSHHLQQPK